MIKGLLKKTKQHSKHSAKSLKGFLKRLGQDAHPVATGAACVAASSVFAIFLIRRARE